MCEGVNWKSPGYFDVHKGTRVLIDIYGYDMDHGDNLGIHLMLPCSEVRWSQQSYFCRFFYSQTRRFFFRWWFTPRAQLANASYTIMSQVMSQCYSQLGVKESKKSHIPFGSGSTALVAQKCLDIHGSPTRAFFARVMPTSRAQARQGLVKLDTRWFTIAGEAQPLRGDSGGGSCGDFWRSTMTNSCCASCWDGLKTSTRWPWYIIYILQVYYRADSSWFMIELSSFPEYLYSYWLSLWWLGDAKAQRIHDCPVA